MARVEFARDVHFGRKYRGTIYEVFALHGALVMFTDISERKSAEAALEKATERLEAIIQNAPIGIAVVTPAGRPVESNKAVQRMLGYSSEELAKMSFEAFTSAEDLEQELPLFEDVLSGRRDGYELEKRYIKKDGSTLWARLVLSALKDSRGEVSFLIGMIEDIKQRKSAESALQYSMDQFDRLMQSGVVGIVHYDSNGRYFDPNNAFLSMTGYSTEELEFHQLNFHDTTLEYQDREQVEAGYVSGSAMPFEREFIRKDGTRLPVMISLTKLNKGTGLAIILDMSELRRAQQEVEQLARIVELPTTLSFHSGWMAWFKPGIPERNGFTALVRQKRWDRAY